MIFEILFRNDLKKLRYKKYQVCKILGITMPTLKTKIENPDKFLWREIALLDEHGFNIINDLLESQPKVMMDKIKEASE